MSRSSMLGVALLFEDDTGMRNEGRLNTAWNLAHSVIQNGGISAPIPTFGKYQGQWKGCWKRAIDALRGARQLRRESNGRIEVLVYIPDASLTPGAALRGLVYRSLTAADALVVVASQRRAVRRSVVVAARLGRMRVITFDSIYARSLVAKGVVAHSVAPGVDCTVFRQRSEAEKASAARALGLGEDESCILHVGHLNKQRGLGVLAALAAQCSARVVVVGSSADEGDQQVIQQLLAAGVLVVKEDFSDIRTVYCAADVYVFPTVDTAGAIGMPLSVLEALAVGVPVVSTPFNDLPQMFPEGSGVYYASTTSDFCWRVNSILTTSTPPVVDRQRLRGWDAVLEEIVRG